MPLSPAGRAPSSPSSRVPLGERILLALSRDPGRSDYVDGTDPWTMENALEPLRRAFPDLRELVRGRRVLDFGCGQGWQSVALAREGASFVLGLDTNTRALERGREVAARAGLDEGRVRFSDTLPPELAGGFDVVISQNSMEHFSDPQGVLDQMRRAVHADGRVLISFGPPWFAPTGSHMHFFTRVPWVHLLFAERTVMAVRGRFRSDGATRYEEVESGLNRMSIAKFERTVRASRFRRERSSYRCVKGVNLLGRIPLARELFINQVDCVLAPDPSAARGA